MADKRKGRQRKIEEEKPTKEEYAVAKFLRFNLPVREGKLHGMEVKCFFGNAAVDKLLESKWSATKNKKDPLFTNRVSCVSYLVRLLEKGLFHRAQREKRKKDKDKDKTKKKRKDKDGEKEETATPPEEEIRKRKGKKDKGKKEKDGETTADDEADKKAEVEKKEEKKDEKKKKEKRLKLIMPPQQFFEDGDEVYVWIYDPVNATTFLIGLLMVLGAIALCMFPLWPEEVRVGVYYLSLAAAGFVGFILLLVVVRLILFCCIWVLTFGKHHFWFLPNLTEDVGFFESFRPLYKHEAVSASEDSKSIDSGKKKKKKGKEEEGKTDKGPAEKKEKSSDKEDSDEFEVIKQEDLDQNGAEEDDENVEDNEADGNDNEGGDIENDYYDDEDDNNGDENGESEEDEEEEEESEPSESGTGDTKKTK